MRILLLSHKYHHVISGLRCSHTAVIIRHNSKCFQWWKKNMYAPGIGHSFHWAWPLNVSAATCSPLLVLCQNIQGEDKAFVLLLLFLNVRITLFSNLRVPTYVQPHSMLGNGDRIMAHGSVYFTPDLFLCLRTFLRENSQSDSGNGQDWTPGILLQSV